MQIVTNKMNLNFDAVIKQEFLNVEEEVISGIPRMDLHIPVKNEPIYEEFLPSVMIKSEPPPEQTSLHGVGTIKSENPEIVTNNEDNFIIYELETPRTTDNIPRLLQQRAKRKNLGNCISSTQIHIPNNVQNEEVFKKSESPLVSSLIQIGVENIQSGHSAKIHMPNIIQNKRDFESSKTPSASNLKQSDVNNITVPTAGASSQIYMPNIIQNKKIYEKRKPSSASNLHQTNGEKITVAASSQIHMSNVIQNKKDFERNKTPMASNLNQNDKKHITAGHIMVATVATSPPILLNTQLRKRHKVILPVSTIDKRARYNIQGTTPKDRSTTNSNASRITNSGSKKIINHLINHKVKLRKPQDQCVSRESTTIARKNNDQDTEKSVASVVGETNLGPVAFSPLTETTEVHAKPEAMKQIPLSSSKKSVGAPIISELRVKCLCSLTDDIPTDNSDLKTFFKEIYEETRHLNKSQQRRIKMLLLKAISDAEESMEQGKCCGF